MSLVCGGAGGGGVRGGCTPIRVRIPTQHELGVEGEDRGVGIGVKLTALSNSRNFNFKLAVVLIVD